MAAAMRPMLGDNASALVIAPETTRLETTASVFVVDAETSDVEALVSRLAQDGFAVDVIADGPATLKYARRARPDAIILEVVLPGMDGLELLLRLRSEGIDAPAVFLSSRGTLEDRLAGLTAGGDDYIVKPCDPGEVVARLGAILRRCPPTSTSRGRARLAFSDLTLDEETREVCKAGEFVALSPNQFDLLRYLMMNARTVLSKPRILDRVWNLDARRDVNMVESYIYQLRRRIDTGDRRLIHTVRGFGYVLRELG